MLGRERLLPFSRLLNVKKTILHEINDRRNENDQNIQKTALTSL